MLSLMGLEIKLPKGYQRNIIFLKLKLGFTNNSRDCNSCPIIKKSRFMVGSCASVNSINAIHGPFPIILHIPIVFGPIQASDHWENNFQTPKK